MASYKQALLVREDLGMSRGKMIVQACHASLKAYRKSGEEVRKAWEDGGEKKIALSADEEIIKEKIRESEEGDLCFATVRDAGRTELEPGTLTAVAVGPEREERVDSVTGELKLIK